MEKVIEIHFIDQEPKTYRGFVRVAVDGGFIHIIYEDETIGVPVHRVKGYKAWGG